MTEYVRVSALSCAVWLVASVAVAGQFVQPAAAKGQTGSTPAATATAPASDNYDALFQQYLNAARNTRTSTPDSLWMAGLFGDTRARHLNDLVTIRVSESVSAQGSADSSLDKNSKASAGVPSFFGGESKAPSFLNPANLSSLGASSSFKGGGSTTRTGTLQAVMTARVAEVFPNGDLGIEGVREIEINGDRQIIVVTGVVRPVDIAEGNVVASAQIGQMRIRYFGRGLIKDNLNPGWLVRVLNKIF